MSELILAIDPGPTESAFVIWDGKAILNKGKVHNNGSLLWEIAHYGCGHGDPLSCIDALVIEEVVSYGMPVGADTFKTVQWYGRYIQSWHMHHHGDEDRIFLVPRKTIVTHHCGVSKGKDANVRQALIDRLGKPGTKKNPGVTYGVKDDIWSALAIALWYDDVKGTSAAIPESKKEIPF